MHRREPLAGLFFVVVPQETEIDLLLDVANEQLPFFDFSLVMSCEVPQEILDVIEIRFQLGVIKLAGFNLDGLEHTDDLGFIEVDDLVNAFLLVGVHFKLDGVEFLDVGMVYFSC